MTAYYACLSERGGVCMPEVCFCKDRIMLYLPLEYAIFEYVYWNYKSKCVICLRNCVCIVVAGYLSVQAKLSDLTKLCDLT